MNLKFYLRQMVKLLTQNVILPVAYRVACLRHRQIQEDLVILADAHHDSLPDSLAAVKEELEHRGYRTQVVVGDVQRSSALESMKSMFSFMDLYARARAVFLCDYYVPAIACRKRPETTLVQLWHACGAFKKFGYDAKDDIPPFFGKDMFRNYDLVTVSSNFCVPCYAGAFHLEDSKVAATGISRTDKFFSEEYREACRRQFFERYPEAQGKKILVWAPTFRGNAAVADLTGWEQMMQLADLLGDSWQLVVKLHPHMEGKVDVDHCSLPIETLMPAADLLISDFSSVIFEFSLFEKPMFLFAPDVKEYRGRRGFYGEELLPGPVTSSVEELLGWIRHLEEDSDFDPQGVTFYCKKQMEACDGHSTERILNRIGLF